MVTFVQGGVRGKTADIPILGAAAALALLAAAEASGISHGFWLSWPRELCVALVVLLAAWSTGRFALARLLGADDAARHGPVVATTAGLAIFCPATMVLGLAGLLRPWLIALLIAVALVPAAREWLAKRRAAALPREETVEGRWPSWPGRLAVIVTLALGFPYAALPPIFYDTLVYHLGFPSQYLATGSLTYWSGSYLQSYPQNAEMLGTIAMALGGEKAAQILGYGIACLVVIEVRRLARREAGAAGADLAFLFLVSQWPFWFGACFGKNDLTGALFLLAALSLALEPSPTRPLRWCAAAGAIAGAAVGVKLTNGLPALLIVLLPALGQGQMQSERARRVAVGVLALVIAASPWMLRNVVYRGNPFFPAFYSLLGGKDFSASAAQRMEGDSLMVLDRSPAAVTDRIAHIGFDRQRYASGGEVSPLTVTTLILGVALARRRRSAAAPAIGLITLVLGVGFLTAVVRVYAIAWVVAGVAAAVVLARFRAWPWRAAVVVAIVAAAIPQFVFSARMLETVSGGGSSVFLGRIDPERYLAERVNYIPVAAYVNEHLADDSRILAVGSARIAYFHRRCDAPSAWDDAWIARASQPGADPAALRDELVRGGYTHVLLNASELGASAQEQRAAGIQGDPAAAQRLNEFFRALRPIFTAEGCTLFELRSP